MTDEVSTTISTIPAPIDPTQPLHLVALDRPQLEDAHVQMIAWVNAKLDKIAVDVDVTTTTLNLAIEHGWVTAAHERLLNRLERDRRFFVKVRAALEAGYVLVPNFAMDVFAIRTAAKGPKQTEKTGRWNNFAQPAQLLAAGEGRYVDPNPRVVTDTRTLLNAKKEPYEQIFQIPVEEFDDVGIPMQLARPEIMTATGRAMALQLFDEVGIARDPARYPDPIVIGRIRNPRPKRPAVSFFIAWYFDPSRL